MSIAIQFVDALNRETAACKLLRPEMFSTQDYTYGVERISHARMIGVIVKAGWSLPGVGAVDVENTFKIAAKCSWKPDVVLRDNDGEVMLAIDFESPNSSDARIEAKDVKPFL